MSYTKIALVVALGVALPACGTTTLSRVSNGTTDQPVWPPVDKARPLVQVTTYPSLAALRKIHPGMTKLEIYQLIGHPHYREGMVGVREWDFLFKLPQPMGTADQYTPCQYKILFDDQMLAREFHWQPETCSEILTPPPAVADTLPAPSPPPGEKIEAFEVSSDLLFDFDSARLKTDVPIDPEVLAKLRSATQVDAIRVIGHTDRLGSVAHNRDLALRRAQAVKNYLVSKGVPAEIIEVQGRGSTEPKVTCNDRARAALIACLAPNRRVRIEIRGH